MTLKLIQPRVHLSVIELLGSLPDGFKQKRLRIQLGVDSEDVEHDPRRRAVVPASNDVAVAEDEHELPLVVVLERGERVERPAERLLAFGVAGDLADDKLVLKLRRAFRRELESGEDCRSGRGSVSSRPKI